MEHYPDAKVYFDGSHYIAIPKESQPWKKRKRVVKKTKNQEILEEKFNKVYKDNVFKKNKEKKEVIENEFKDEFNSKQELEEFVDKNLEKKKRNYIVRQTRLMRKVHLHEWNYFCTFTYDESKLTEQDFKKKLLNCFKKRSHRDKWKYIGAWERSPVNQRLHFHGIFYIPKMIGELIEKKDYNTTKKRMQVTNQNTYFLKKFGRNDFQEINKFTVGQSVRYLVKYIEKSGEKMIYSRGIPTYFRSDILPSDVICRIGQEDRKLLLADNFHCLKDGELIGRVSPEVIQQMKTSN